MTQITINDANTYLTTVGANRRVCMSARHIGATLHVSMTQVIAHVSKMKSGLEFHLFDDNKFHVFMHGDYVGRFRMLDGKYVISSQNIKRKRSSSGLDANEELSSSYRNIALKMANSWTHLSYGRLRDIATYLVNRMYSDGTPNNIHNKVDHRPIRKIMETFSNLMYARGYLIPNSFCSAYETDMLWNLMYHILLAEEPAKKDLEWSETPSKPSLFKTIVGEFSERSAFIAAVEDYADRYARKERIVKEGYILRINRNGTVNVILNKPKPKHNYNPDFNVPRYHGADGLVGGNTDPFAVSVKSKIVDGINAMNVAGHFRYVEGVGVRLTEMPEQTMLLDGQDTLTAGTIYWVEETFIAPLTPYHIFD